jgi:NAD+ kinase
MGITGYHALDVAPSASSATWAGGGWRRHHAGHWPQLARYGVPLIGINQGRLGFITDIPYDSLPPALARCCKASL